MIRTFALAAAASALLAGCGGDDDEAGTGTTSAPAATTTEAAGNTFESADVGFTFSYPEGFEQADDPGDGKVLAVVTPAPGDIKNGLKVRKTSDQELTFDSYSGQISSQFEQQLGTKVTVTTESHGDTDFGVMDWSTAGLRSTSYFFTASGKTWQLECLSTAQYRDDVTAACEQAVTSIEES